MNKTFYSDYVRHCLRFYARYPTPNFRTPTDKHNWTACDKAFRIFSDEERELLMDIYSRYDTLPDNVFCVCTERAIEQDDVWKLIEELEYVVALKRGLYEQC